MKNIIRINLDVNERNESNIGIPLPQKVIRSKDTAVIIEMRIIGYDVNDGYTFTLLSEYTKSKRHTLYTIGDRLKIEGNVVTFVPPAELISTLEIVTNTLYIEKSGVSLDFSKFHYLAQLSEVDNTVGPVKEVYDDNYQALIDELEFKYMLIEDLTAEYVAAQVAEARVGSDGTIYRFLKERLDVEHQKVTAQVGEVSHRLELTNNEIIDARGGKPTLSVRLDEISRVDEYGKHWTLIDGEWEERVGQSQLINVRGEVAWAMAEAEQAKEDAIKAYEDAVAEAKRSADIEDTLIRTKIQQGLSAVETELSTAKQEAKDATNQALTDAKAHADAEVQASKEHFDGLIAEVESEVADAQATADSAVEQIDTAVANAGFTSLDETISNVQTISNQAQINASTAIDNAQAAMSSASTAISDASQAKADAQEAITEAGEAVDSANTAKTNAQTALEDAQTALSTAENADTKSGLAEAAANTAKANAQTAIDDAQSALTTAGNAKTTADTLSIKVDDLEGEVELKASQTEVDGISGTVSTHTTTLSQHATAISSKAESELVDTIKGTVDTHTTEISQNATDIASKASTTTVNTLTGRVDTAESNISQNATAITQRVTTTTYNTGIANKENTVLKQTTAPTHVNGRLWLDTSVTPNILKRSNGTTWIKATPTTPGEVGAYSQSDGAGLAGRLTTAETNITQTATAIISKADKSTVDTLEGIVSTQGTTITQQADLIASKASQTEVDTVKGTVSGHTTTLSQHANQIASKAESNLVNAIKGTVDNHTTEISQNATDIASKASSSSVNTLTGRVSTAETTISQHATAITSKASQSEVDTVKGTVAGHTTTLSQHATQIGARLTSSQVNNLVDGKGFSTVNYVDNQITASASGIRADMSVVEGKIPLDTDDKNYLPNSESEWVTTGFVTNSAYGVYLQGRDLTDIFKELVGEIKISVDVFIENAELEYAPVRIYGHNSSPEYRLGALLINNIKTNEWVRVSGTTDITYQGTDGNSRIEVFGNSVSSTTKIRIRKMKIGRVYSSDTWSPAPEDALMQNDFTVFTGEYEATAENLSSRLTAVDKVGGRLHTAETNISQNATGIASKASTSSVNALTGRVSTAETTLTQHATSISSKVSMSDVEGFVDEIRPLKNLYGGTWYSSGSNVSITYPSNDVFRVVQVSDYSEVVDSINRIWNPGFSIIRGTNVIISGEIRMVSGSSGNVTFTQTHYPPNRGFEVQATESWEYFGGTYTALSNNAFSLYFHNKGTYEIRNLTIHLGGGVSKNQINYIESEISQKHDSITATVSSLDGRVATTELNLDGLTTTVQSVRTDLTGTTTLLNTTRTTVSGHTSTIATLRTDVNGKATTSQFNTLNSTVNGTITRVGTAEGKITQIETSVSGLQTTVASKASQTQVTQLSDGINLLSEEVVKNLYSGTWSNVGANLSASYPNGILRVVQSVDSSAFSGERDRLWGAGFSIKQDTSVNVSGEVRMTSGSSGGITFTQTHGGGVNKGFQVSTSSGWSYFGGTYTALNNNAFSLFFHNIGTYEIKDLKVTLGGGASAGQLSVLEDNINLRVSKGDVLSQINIEADRTLIQSNKLVLDADSVVFTGSAFIPSAQIQSIHANKINAGTIATVRLNATEIVAQGLVANVVTATHIKSDTALIDNIFSTQAMVDRLWAKAIWTNKITAMEIDAGKITSGTINTARLNVTDLRTKILYANAIKAEHIHGDTALFDKLFSTTSSTTRLVARGAWITNANIISLNANKITAGTISADRISTSSLANLEIGGRNLIKNSDAFYSWVGTHNITNNTGAFIYITAPFTPATYQIEARAIDNSVVGATFGWQWSGSLRGETVKLSKDWQRASFLLEHSGSIGLRVTGGLGLIELRRIKAEKGNKATDWTPAPEDVVNDLGSSGKVVIHGGNIKANTLDVGKLTGNLGEFINLSLKAQNSQASLSGASFRIESIANNQSYIEMSNAPEIRARSADSSMAVMGQGRTSYRYDGSERFYFGSKLNGWQNGMMIRKHHGWGIMRESDSSNGVPAKYYTVKAGQQRVAVIEALMRDPTVTEVPTGNETQFIINSNYLGRLNGYTNSTSSTIAYPWPTLRTGDLIKYAEEIPGNESGVQQVFDIWDDNNTTVSAFGVHVTFHGGYSGASDRNIKHDIKDTAVEALAHIESLTFKEFRYNQDNRYEPIGMIAQDSGILRVNSDKVESIDIQRSIMLSLKGLQELQDIVKRQAEEIKQLKEIINQ